MDGAESFQLSPEKRAVSPSRDRPSARLVSTCELARINEVSRAESERIELQSHPAAHRLLFQPSDEKQSGRKFSPAFHLWNSSCFRNGGGSVLGGCPPLAGNISEIRVSFRPTNFRVGEKWPWNSEWRSAEIVKCIRKLLLLRQTAFCVSFYLRNR